MTGKSTWNRPVLNGHAEDIYAAIHDLPIVSPHGHCDPAWFADNTAFSDPAELLIIPDHYVFRLLYSQGIPLEKLGIGVSAEDRISRDIFRLFARHWHLFLGTPSRQWLDYTFSNVLGITVPLTEKTSDEIYDQIAQNLQSDTFRPRALFDRFNIEVLATTDGALSDLRHHQQIAGDEWAGRVVPTFRPDSVLNPAHPHFAEDVARMGEMCGCDTHTYGGYLGALRQRRATFIENGATATDHDVPDLSTQWLCKVQVGRLFELALKGQLDDAGSTQFYGHMLIEMAQMSIDDGLVMQLHVGSARSTNTQLLSRFGPDMGADIPKSVDWVGGLNGLLNRVGNDPNLTIIAFTLAETSYARELAPMAGHWPALKLGPPWWFHDSLNGIRRYFDQVVETAGYWNLTGFNDDTRAFLSIPARHDLWRRGVSLHLAEQIDHGLMNKGDARHIAAALAHDLAVENYRLGGR